MTDETGRWLWRKYTLLTKIQHRMVQIWRRERYAAEAWLLPNARLVVLNRRFERVRDMQPPGDWP